LSGFAALIGVNRPGIHAALSKPWALLVLIPPATSNAEV